MKEKFTERTFQRASRTRIGLCNEIIKQYLGLGLRLTLRQLYYQLVSRNTIANSEAEYKSLGKLLSEARLAGLVDWDAIEDRVRRPMRPSEFSGLGQLVEAALYSYRLPRWGGQRCYVELWVEKDALSGVLSPMASEFHITLMVNRGYSSQSAMYEAAKRFKSLGYRKDCRLYYLGDHDPSGEDMVRDVGDRLERFGCSVTVKKVALTMAQVEQYKPPPNPAKLSDSRAPKYVERHGDESWEVDALPPEVLQGLIRSELAAVLDVKKMDAIKARERKDKARLRAVVAEL